MPRKPKKSNTNLDTKDQSNSKPQFQSSEPTPSTVKIKKSSLAGLIIVVLVLVALIAGAIGGAVVYFVAQQTKMPDWADTYLAHIKSVRRGDQSGKSSSASAEEVKIWTDPESKPQVSFYESRDNSPMMLVNYTSVENTASFNSVAVYSIQNEEIYLLNYENTNLYYATNIVLDIDVDTDDKTNSNSNDKSKDTSEDAPENETKIDESDSGFYLKTENSTSEDTYVSIDDYFQNPEADDSAYETTCSTDEAAENFCGDLIAAEPVELPSFAYTDDMSDKQLSAAVAENSTDVMTEAAVEEQTAAQLQQSVAAAKERIEEKNKIPETFTVGNKTLRFGEYETVDDTGRATSEIMNITLNPDMTATYSTYDQNSSGYKTVTTPFAVRPIQNGDVLQTGIGCVAADGGPCFNSTLNGHIAIIISPDGVYNKYNRSFLVTHEASSDPSKHGGPLPYGCDFEPAAGHQYFCYRFVEK